MNWREEHLQAVRKRWQEKRQQSKLPEEDFLTYARETLLSYGWSAADVEKILK